ncbi:MAG: hypothetical protein QOE36_3335 [Gaiellaceae bacterium]|jgi:uncharacterized protein YndB with AHSA1/START domain|nr:hypothetical protein [Gaiellaceae bacterium]
MSDTSTSGREATITRVFDAPRDELWKYFTEPELFASWFGTPPYTTPPSRVSMDVRPGGRWQATMVHETDGSELPFRGTFGEIVEHERLVQIFEDVENPDNKLVETLTTTLEDAGEGKTRATYHQVGHMPEEQYRAIEQGVNGFYDRLAEQLAR